MSARRLHYALQVNGEVREVSARPEATLLEVLREGLGLTGTKCGCNHGVCGACSVLIEGRLSRSCLALAADVGERPVTTVEGLADAGRLSPVQEALVDAGAIQCGFCTPGFVMALTELFAREPHPGRDEVRAALAGNLCRCSGYVQIVQAAMNLAAAEIASR
jgi:carbon-monoxide dehydrogenase small subunit